MGNQYIIEKTAGHFDPKQSGFEDNVNRLSEIRELITESPLTVYNNTIKKQYAILPYNYFGFVEAEANTIFSCNDNAVVSTTQSHPEYVSTLSFKKSNFTDQPNPFSLTKIYKVINTTPIEIFDFSDFSTGLSSLDEIFTVKNKILEEINRQTNIKVYWEKYRNLYLPDTLIFVSEDPAFTGQSMKIEYSGPGVILQTVFSTNNYTITISGDDSSDEKDSYGRLLSNEEIYHMLVHPFGTTSPESPILSIQDQSLIIHTNKRFILKGLTLKYIRKPRRMNLTLNQSYEIQDSRALEKIIDMTVEYLSAVINSQGYQALTIENQQRD